LLALTALVVIRARNLFAVVMLSGIYSLLSAGLFVVMDAVDVAFTEAAVGAGVSTVFMLGALALTTSREKPPTHNPILPLVVVLLTGAALVYGTLDMPLYGQPDNPIHQHVAPRYINDSMAETGIPNIVTSVLASYRGYDTLGETAVVFTAAVGGLLLVGGRRRRGDKDDSA
jgi:multicomponent Na+:H+ antiporter subunit B